MASQVYELIKKSVKELILTVQTTLPEDVRKILESLRSRLSDKCRILIDCMLKNCELAKTEAKPICQDTGTPLFYLRIGTGFQHVVNWCRLLTEAYAEAVQEIPLRPNAVDPVTNRNTGTGVGLGIPVIDVEYVDTDHVEIWYIAKGGGSELPCRALCTIPEKGWEKLPKIVEKLVEKYGRYICPPAIVGIGIGATLDSAVKLAKKALFLRKIGERNSIEKIAKLEEYLVDLLNRKNIGIQGLGEGPTILDVHIEVGCRHPATFCIAVLFCCWVVRRGLLRIYNDLRKEIVL